MKTKVLVAGLSGASLGTEILKCLYDTGAYEIFGCDIAPLAYGLYSDQLSASYVVDKEHYIESIISLCTQNDIRYIIPGGEQPMVLLAVHNSKLLAYNLILVSNSAEIIDLFSNKHKTFEFLKKIGVPTPLTKKIQTKYDLEDFQFPCIIKPSSGTGGSDSVFLATSMEECILYTELLIRNQREVIAQEYIGLEEGEFTIGVLSDTKGNIIGSVAMQRVFNSKLSVSYRGSKGLISSGYSQGLISDFKDLRIQAEKIARASGSRGPFNVQGRVRDGILIPFEINPRFSASTHLRNLAGFNEIHYFMQYLIQGIVKIDWQLKEGYYLRSFDELYLPLSNLKN